MACSLQHLSRHSFNALTGLSCYALAGGIALSSTAFQCPLGLIPHFYLTDYYAGEMINIVSMPSRAYTSFLRWKGLLSEDYAVAVSMPSRAYTSFLLAMGPVEYSLDFTCQCPLGLIPHFYMVLILKDIVRTMGVNALSGLYLISTVPLQKPRFYAVFRTCFCRYLSEYSDNSRFSCMLTFWTYLMRYTYP